MSITAAALQAAAEAAYSSAGEGTVYQVIQGPISLGSDGEISYDGFYCVGVTEPYAGRAMWVRVNAAGNAAAQHAEVDTALQAGPCDTNALDN